MYHGQIEEMQQSLNAMKVKSSVMYILIVNAIMNKFVGTLVWLKIVLSVELIPCVQGSNYFLAIMHVSQG
jgi:hypothetical protein